MVDEFALIQRFFNREHANRIDVALGIGDDCALLEVPADSQLAVSIDTLVAGVHFTIDTAPYDIAYKALATNLSDLAAMGAEPAWVTLALTLPESNENWLAGFSQGFFDLADQFNLQLIGGDTTRGPLSISMQVHGFIPKGKALTRAGAQPGDVIYVTGSLGDAGLALQLGKQAPATLVQRLLRPVPRVAEGLWLRRIATSAIDISDGLAADLGHILTRSEVGATIYVEHLPLSTSLLAHTDLAHAQQLALSAGDDYELCFTVPPQDVVLLQHMPMESTCIGVIEVLPGLRIQQQNEAPFLLAKKGFQHF